MAPIRAALSALNLARLAKIKRMMITAHRQHLLLTARVTAPVAMPLQSSDGAVYVTTSDGGPVLNGLTDRGGVFSYTAALPKPKPVINFLLPAHGVIGSTVLIGGANFIKAKKVTFGGVNAAFTVEASGFISAMVPVGAASGDVKVVTAGGAAVSPAAFAIP